jgi:hypothetical protein
LIVVAFRADQVRSGLPTTSSRAIVRARRRSARADIAQIVRDGERDESILGWRKEYFAQWPYAKNLVPHNSLYNYARMQEVWLDR